MTKEILSDDFKHSTFWQLTDENGIICFEVKCHGLKLQRFDCFDSANLFLNVGLQKLRKSAKIPNHAKKRIAYSEWHLPTPEVSLNRSAHNTSSLRA